ncbi:flagellar basal body rod protein FlgC [Parachitinimonas caeni]|uniref:Flagellar basal-body rod protein FlgC n=1 Tax=Parachitinimonas caeni TaxID=3031301 RepID=A0ABT7DYH7_9NEIS|nr:flagellar basal body rod protein FlgC [Parachitinimonas caeni]MDK2125121.1 flagellar basal body rod protein FlgC [Parachitinimonas caeni]
MDYRSAFAISAVGMGLEKLRLDVTAQNLANMNVSAPSNGKLYKPLRLQVSTGVSSFSGEFEQASSLAEKMLKSVKLEEIDVSPRMVYEPGHPDANESGYVALPGVNHLSEMVNLSTALRAYEANVVAMNAAKTMAIKALELGN